MTAMTNDGDKREAMRQWFRDAKFGLFIHWGIYSVTGRGEWLRSAEKVPEDVYAKQIPLFTAEKFDAVQWAKLAKEAGVNYVVFTTKHHDGFCMFDAHNTDWKVTNSPCGRDVLAELTQACIAEGLKVGFYYSIMDWHHPDYLPRLEFEVASRPAEGHQVMDYIAYMREHLHQLLTEYGEAPFVLWYDGGWMNTPDDLGAVETNAMARRWHPGLLINDRHHTEEDLITPEQSVPATGLVGADGKPALWEACITMTSYWWGYDAYERHFKEPDYLLRMLVDIVSKGGNYLLNIGPKPDGTIQKEFVSRLKIIGRWLAKYGDAIYQTTPSPFNMLPFFGRVTCKGNRLFVHLFLWPKCGYVLLPNLEGKILSVKMMGGHKGNCLFRRSHGGWKIFLPKKTSAKKEAVTVIEVEMAAPPVVTPVVIRPNRGGDVPLPVLYGKIQGPHGQRIRYEVHRDEPVVGNWSHPADYISWEVELPEAANYELWILSHVSVDCDGLQYALYVNPSSRSALAPNGLPVTGGDGVQQYTAPPEKVFEPKKGKGKSHWQNVGTVSLKAGKNDILIVLQELKAGYGMIFFDAKLVRSEGGD